MRWTPKMPERVASPGMRAVAFAATRSAVHRIVVMTYDQGLAGRIRQLIDGDPELTEKMFGGARLPHPRQHGHRRQQRG